MNPHAPSIDGKLGDSAWEKTEWQGDFTQREPYEGAKPSERTLFKILFDDKALYVAVRAFDSMPAKIDRRVSRRDDVDGDCGVHLDSYFDKRTAFGFKVNAAGVKADAAPLRRGTATRTSAGTRLGRVKQRPTPAAGRPRCPSPSASCASRQGRADLRPAGPARPLPQQEPSSGSTSPRTPRASSTISASCRDCRASGPAPVEIIPYAVARAYRPVAGNPFATGSSGKLRRPRRQDRPDQRPDPRLHPQPRLRPGRGRPVGGQPDRL